MPMFAMKTNRFSVREELLQDLVGAASDRWTSDGRLTGIAEKYGARAVPAKIAFLTISKALLKDIPLKIFPDPESRLNILLASQTALNKAIELEEEGAGDE